MQLEWDLAASILFIAISLIAVLSIVYASWRNGISPMPSSARVRRAVADEITRLNQPPGLIVEAGSGWGTLGLSVAKNCDGWRVRGIENSPIPLFYSRMASWLTFGLQPRASFRYGDIYRHSYEDADIVLCYLYPGAMKRLDPILRQRLAPETRVISICFAIPGWKAAKVIQCDDLYRTALYVYDKGDQWRVEA
ncbi:class I SAM-dependent methyltransferase [Cohnella endophytica]|uniref:Class I SAM-dependent methyltransferase n=1 Tax=Cohnella endophytica TaxID=2419778 RepID=A0A494XVM6_9BACL|nr:class I SAM-dependent methyltransferase [Cohnella endophytica]RKP51643.1 class I SAM-dependent methyltransferase [Cohnella endophytica]